MTHNPPTTSFYQTYTIASGIKQINPRLE